MCATIQKVYVMHIYEGSADCVFVRVTATMHLFSRRSLILYSGN